MNDGLVRQRRNLFVSGILLLIFCYGDVEISGLSILNMKLSSFKNENLLPVGLWIIFGYFFIRYFQYFYGHGLVAIRNKLEELQEKCCSPLIEKHVREKYPYLNNAMR